MKDSVAHKATADGELFIPSWHTVQLDNAVRPEACQTRIASSVFPAYFQLFSTLLSLACKILPSSPLSPSLSLLLNHVFQSHQPPAPAPCLCVFLMLFPPLRRAASLCAFRASVCSSNSAQTLSPLGSFLPFSRQSLDSVFYYFPWQVILR